MPDDAAKIAALNDQTRKSLTGCRIMLTRGVQGLETRPEIMKAFREFDTWNDGNDPWSEHDFFSFEVEGVKIFAKCDYYTPDLAHGSEDPTSEDPNICVRVWTLMLPEEY